MNTQEEKPKINPLVFVVLVVYPAIILGLGIWYSMVYGISSFEVILFIGTYYAANISIGVGLHRAWSHGAYKLNKYVEFVLAMLSAGTLQGPALVWCSDHYKHHTYTDQEGDPHTPKKYDDPWKGFFWAHMGWMLFGTSAKHIDKITLTKLGRNKILRWQMKYYWQIATVMNGVLPPLIGYFASGMTLHGALSAFIFMGLARALQQQMTFCVNSVLHFSGSRKYYIGTARDNWWLSIFLLGENWHNFHHAFARDYRNGVKWYHPDVHKWIIYSLEKLGLATEVVRTPDVRIKAKMEETKLQMQEQIKTKLSLLEETAIFIAKAAEEKLKRAEVSATGLAQRARAKIELVHAKALALADEARINLSSTETLSFKIAAQYTKQLHKIERAAKQFGVALPMMHQ